MVRTRLLDELRDPWGPLLGAVLGGVTWAVGVPVLAAVGVGAAVLGVKAAAGVLLDHGSPDRVPLPRPDPASPAGTWLDRAERAHRDLVEQARTCPPGQLVSSAAERAASDAGAVLDAVRRLAAQQVAVTAALRRADSPGLDGEAASLLAGATPDEASSLQSVQDRIAVRDRLRGAQQQLVGRLQSAALGLEGVSARVAELVAMAADAGAVDPTRQDLQALTTEVEGLRQGLVESEQTARGVLGND